jgi:putative addiction module CopG family antidote
MIERKNVSVSLPPELHAFVNAHVHSGCYSSVSEVVREALRLLIEREQRKIASSVHTLKRPHV